MAFFDEVFFKPRLFLGIDMSNQITADHVRRVARLSRLDLTEEEIQEFTGQLGAILDYVNKMNELDTENVEPLAHCLPVTNCFRDDIIHPSLECDKALANAPDRDGDYFKVPKILGDQSGA